MCATLLHYMKEDESFACAMHLLRGTGFLQQSVISVSASPRTLFALVKKHKVCHTWLWSVKFVFFLKKAWNKSCLFLLRLLFKISLKVLILLAEHRSSFRIVERLRLVIIDKFLWLINTLTDFEFSEFSIPDVEKTCWCVKWQRADKGIFKLAELDISILTFWLRRTRHRLFSVWRT